MATKRVVVEGSLVTASQLQDFFRQIGDRSINSINLQRFLDHQDPFALDGVVIDWTRVYKALDMKFEPGDLLVKPDPAHFDVYVLRGVTSKKVVEAFRKLGVAVNTYGTNLDKDVLTNDRDPKNASYRVRFQKTVESDPELATESASDLKEEQIQTITFLERLLLGLGYFLMTGYHLDVENITLCAGSRDSHGRVPTVCWCARDRDVSVGWRSSIDGPEYLRARAVVS